MAAMTGTNRASGTRVLRAAAWGGAAVLLALPAVAMLVTREVMWTTSDFCLFAAMLGVALGGFEFLMRRSGDLSYRLGSAMALGATFLLVWVNLAVGVIGSEDDPANLLFFGVPAVGAIVAAIGRFRPAGMARAMIATATAQASVGVAALVLFGFYRTALAVTLAFAALWLASAVFFVRAAR